jgi:hypothetical protein
LPDREEKTNDIFEFSAKHAVGFTYFISYDKKLKLFCYPMLSGQSSPEVTS